MDSALECTCCLERQQVVRLLHMHPGFNGPLQCITTHPGFEAVCLDVYVLQTAYYQYRQEHGNVLANRTINEYDIHM